MPFPEDNDLAITRECRAALAANGGEALGFVNFEGCITAKVMVAALERSGASPERNGFVESLSKMSAVDLGGLQVSFGPENHQASNAVFLTHIQGGKIAKLR